MLRQLVRLLVRIVQVLCAIGVVAPFLSARLDTFAGIKTIQRSYGAVGSAAEAIDQFCARTDCRPYAGTKPVEDFVREMRLPAYVPFLDRWGHPLRAIVSPQLVVVASAGSDGVFADDFAALFAVPVRDQKRLLQQLGILRGAVERRHWDQSRGMSTWDRVAADNRAYACGKDVPCWFVGGETELPSDEVPPGATVRAGLLASGALALFAMLQGTLQSPRRILLRLVQALCVAGFFVPFFLATRWVTRTREPIRRTLSSVTAAADAIERLGCSRKDCPVNEYTGIIHCAPDCKPYPEAPEITTLRDGWGRPLHITSGPEHYVIASGGADGKLDERATSRTPFWYDHLGDDFVFADGSYRRTQAFADSDAASEAPGRILLQYALLTALPSLTLLIGTFFIGRKRNTGISEPRAITRG